MELALVPFVLPLLLIGRLIDLLRPSERPIRIDERAWRTAWSAHVGSTQREE